MDGKKILIVEDEAIVAMDIQGQLNEIGYQVVGTANSGKAAIEKAGRLKPHAVLMDMRLMGEMNGIEAAAYIQKHFIIPVIFLTAYSDDKTIRLAQEAHSFGYLVKPVFSKDLYAAIETALTKHQRETSLRESENFVRGILDSLSANICLVDQDGMITLVNQAWEEFARQNGVPNLSLIGTGMNYREVCRLGVENGDEDARITLAGIEAILQGSSSRFDLEYSCHAPTEKRWFLLTITPFSGQPRGAVIAHLNISARVMAEQEAHQRVNELEALREISAAITSSLDFDTVMLRILENVAQVVPHDAANFRVIEDGFARVAYCRGYSDEFANFLLNFSLHIDTTPNLKTMLQTQKPQVIPDTKENPAWVSKPETDWIHSFMSIPIIIHGKVIGFLSLDSAEANTLTAEYIEPLVAFANQAAIAIENARLYEQTDEQLQLTNQLLLEQADQLRRALQVKSAFLQRMSHELRTPLNAVIGFSGMLQNMRIGTLNEKQLQYSQNIQHSGKQLLALVNDVLDLTAVEVGDLKLTFQFVLVSDLFGLLNVQIAEKVQTKNIRLLMKPDKPDLKVWGGNTRLGQILFNLLDNALKFSPVGSDVRVQAKQVNGRELAVRAVWSVENDQNARDFFLKTDRWTLFTVQDSGIGIKEEDFSKIFTQFEQIENPLNRQQEGSGLGLALTKSLVELHGGQIWFESVFEEGATFYVAIPDMETGVMQ